ncbi:MAG: hypothetical protein LBN12_06150 [Clostridiales Family XIII bacterium]|jgi:hypothetical protein|nr:hypothetical protein [Clostridiales Family XIII bacterium]
MGITETGRVALTNTKVYPFNDSVQTVALKIEQPDPDYLVVTEVLHADGEVGDVEVTAKAVNGFKVGYTGSAKNTKLGYAVIGGR